MVARAAADRRAQNEGALDAVNQGQIRIVADMLKAPISVASLISSWKDAVKTEEIKDVQHGAWTDAVETEEIKFVEHGVDGKFTLAEWYKTRGGADDNEPVQQMMMRISYDETIDQDAVAEAETDGGNAILDALIGVEAAHESMDEWRAFKRARIAETRRVKRARIAESRRVVQQGDEVAVIESVKAASEFFVPVSGEIMGTNGALAEDPGVINSDPMEVGWFFSIRLSQASELEKLMDQETYNNFIKSLD